MTVKISIIEQSKISEWIHNKDKVISIYLLLKDVEYKSIYNFANDYRIRIENNINISKLRRDSWIGILYEAESNLDSYYLAHAWIKRCQNRFQFLRVHKEMVRGKEWCYYLFGKTDNPPPATNKHVILCSRGYGTSLMLLPLIQQFIYERFKEGETVELLTYSSKTKKIADTYLRNATINFMNLHRPDLCYEVFVSSGLYQSVINLNNIRKTSPPSIHVVESAAKLLGINVENAYYNNPIIPIVSQTSSQLLEQMKAIRSEGRKLVGIQFETGTNPEKNWSDDHVKAFTFFCLEKNICLLQLNSGKRISGAQYCGDFTVPEMLAIVKCLDAVVSIDSYSGHAAALMGIPTISIWGKNDPLCDRPLVGGKYYTSYRPIRLNLSLVHSKLDSHQVDPNDVFYFLWKLLCEDLSLSKDTYSEKNLNNEIRWLGQIKEEKN
ncbi:MAG: glycosyltransferase family 9 protein [Bacillota bacterium]